MLTFLFHCPKKLDFFQIHHSCLESLHNVQHVMKTMCNPDRNQSFFLDCGLDSMMSYYDEPTCHHGTPFSNQNIMILITIPYCIMYVWYGAMCFGMWTILYIHAHILLPLWLDYCKGNECNTYDIVVCFLTTRVHITWCTWTL